MSTLTAAGEVGRVSPGLRPARGEGPELSARDVVLGLDFGGSKTAAAVSSLDGTTLDQRLVETDPVLGAEANLSRALELARSLLADLDGAPDPSRLVAVGACTFGIPREHGVELSPAIPGWDRLRLGHELREAFGVPVQVMTDVKAAASAEARLGALVGADPGLYLNLGTGLAAAIVHGGDVVTGAHGASGEIGYCLRTPEDVKITAKSRSGEPEGPVLEDLVSGMGLSAALGSLGGDGSSPARHLAASDVFERAASEPALEQIVRQFLMELAFHLVNATIALDPERIAVGGGMVGSWDVIGPALASALEAHVPYPPELVLGAFPHDAALRGAVQAALQLAANQTVGAQ